MYTQNICVCVCVYANTQLLNAPKKYHSKTTEELHKNAISSNSIIVIILILMDKETFFSIKFLKYLSYGK